MIIRDFQLDDFEEIVSMFYRFTREVYPDRKTGAKYFFYRAIQDWINKSVHIVVSEDDGIITGFSKCQIDDMGGVTESVYQCDFAYVKPEYRKGRSAYMLYNNAYNYAKQRGLIINSQGRISNGVSNMMKKHFDLKEKFIVMEG